MDVRRILLASLGVVVVCASVPAGSQTLSKLMIASPCQAGVSLSLYDPAGLPRPPSRSSSRMTPISHACARFLLC